VFAWLDAQPMGQVVRMYADSKYQSFRLYQWVDEHAKWDLEIHRPADKRAWVKLLNR